MNALHRAAFAAGFLAAVLAGTAGVAAEPDVSRSGVSRTEMTPALAMHGLPALAPSFDHFPYTNPSARKGGRLKLGIHGSFDSLNPLIVRGVAADGVRDFVLESLMTRGLDEPFTLYPLIAESVEVPADRSSVTFHIDPRARFSDGQPVTVDDVIFSLEVLRDHGRPNHRAYYKKVGRIERLSERAVRFAFDGGGDREMPLILGLMPVLPHHLFKPETFENTSLVPIIGSGPYRIERIDPGRAITYVRDPGYWGNDLPVTRGRFNFATVSFDYFRDRAVLIEAFKNGDIDALSEDDPSIWAEGYRGPAVSEGRIVKESFDIGVPAGMSGLVFNSRRPMFAEPRVRAAFIQLFDFEWLNRSLFHGFFRRTDSYFARSSLASAGRPADATERRLLAPYAQAVDGAILEGRSLVPRSDGTGHNRDSWRAAFALFKAAGYGIRDGRLVFDKTGEPFTFEILVVSAAQERLLANFVADLQRFGIRATVRLVDSAQYQARLRSYDYDMIQWSWAASLSPGNEQLFRWSALAADQQGSYNYAGVKSPAVDAMIDSLLRADAESDFIAAVRALDRVLLSGHYVIPLFYLPQQWVAHWRRLKHPATTSLAGYQLDTWWNEPE